MKAVTLEWVEKAEEDWSALDTLFRARKSSHHNNVCFHAQQCAEKYLKGRLVEAGFTFPKTHDLLKLLAWAAPVEPSWGALHSALSTLASDSVLYRYPDFHADRVQAGEARRLCQIVR